MKATAGDAKALERIVLIPIVREEATERRPSSSSSTQAVADQFAAFDAGAADCHRPEDREQLLGVIESGYGTLHEFNAAVRSALAPKATPAAPLCSGRRTSVPALLRSTTTRLSRAHGHGVTGV